MIEAVVEGIIEDSIRFVGWTALKVLTFGRYRSDGSGAFFLEGSVGLAMIVGTCIGLYMLA